MTDITLREAAQQALEALNSFLSDDLRPYQAAKVSDALRAALAEPVQEPNDTPFDRWWNDALDGPPPIASVSKETAQWIWDAASKAEIYSLREAEESLREENERLREALKSIAANTCCDRCREAALVARAALRREESSG